jgi:hypothetical protein
VFLDGKDEVVVSRLLSMPHKLNRIRQTGRSGTFATANMLFSQGHPSIIGRRQSSDSLPLAVTIFIGACGRRRPQDTQYCEAQHGRPWSKSRIHGAPVCDRQRRALGKFPPTQRDISQQCQRRDALSGGVADAGVDIADCPQSAKGRHKRTKYQCLAAGGSVAKKCLVSLASLSTSNGVSAASSLYAALVAALSPVPSPVS